MQLSSAVNKDLNSAITFELGHWRIAIGRNQCLHRRIADSNHNQQITALGDNPSCNYSRLCDKFLAKSNKNRRQRQLVGQLHAVSPAVGCGESDFPRELTFLSATPTRTKTRPDLPSLASCHAWPRLSIRSSGSQWLSLTAHPINCTFR